MDKIRRYVECYVPITTCNLKCHYCYITRQQKWKDKILPIGHSSEEIAMALSKKRLGGTCLINMCGGGETLLCPDIVSIVKGLLEEGHYVMLVTNGTMTKILQQFTELPKDLLKHLTFKFSYHFLELRRLGITELFFNNIEMMRNAGCSFTLEITPNDELIPLIQEVKDEVKKYMGALCHITIARDDITESIPILTDLQDDDFYQIWGQFNSDLFEFKKSIFGKHQCGFCYAGDWSVYVHLGTGVMSQCYAEKELDNIYENINKPLHFRAVGRNCSSPHCYNGHAFLALGDIPEMETPTYAQLRNRKDEQGREWLNEDAKQFLSGKLSDENKEYSKIKKWWIDRK